MNSLFVFVLELFSINHPLVRKLSVIDFDTNYCEINQISWYIDADSINIIAD